MVDAWEDVKVSQLLILASLRLLEAVAVRSGTLE